MKTDRLRIGVFSKICGWINHDRFGTKIARQNGVGIRKGSLFHLGFNALMPSRMLVWKEERGFDKKPRIRLGARSALRSVPTVALSSVRPQIL